MTQELRFGIRLDADTLATLLRLAKAREVSKSEVIREAVRNMAQQLDATAQRATQPNQPTNQPK